MEIKTKQDEKNILDALKQADTYFSDQFSDRDIEAMKKNIDNDHHLLFGVMVSQHMYEELYATSNSIQKEVDSLRHRNVKLFNHVNMMEKDMVSLKKDNALLEEENNKYKRDYIVKKLTDNVALSPEEKQWVFKNLK